MNKFLFVFKSIFIITIICQSTFKASADTPVFQTKIDGANFSISSNPNNGSYNIQISANGKIEVLDIFDLANPSRLVIDLKHVNISRNGNYTINNDSLFSQMRIGKHNDKIRLVLDLKSQKVPQYTWEPIDSSSISVFLSNTQTNLTKTNSANKLSKEEIAIEKLPETLPHEPAKNTVVPVEEKLKKIEVPQEAISAAGTKLGDLNAIQEKTNTEVENTEIEETQDPKTDISPQGLENIKFYYQKEKNTPLVRFILVKKPEYRLKKESEKKYILTIPDCTIRWPHLELPQFPPRDFRGFTMVMPEKSGSDLNIAIGIERGGSISSFTKNNEIWLKAN